VEGTGASCLIGRTGSGFANLSLAFSAENTVMIFFRIILPSGEFDQNKIDSRIERARLL
jgi:hypothetical protein